MIRYPDTKQVIEERACFSASIHHGREHVIAGVQTGLAVRKQRGHISYRHKEQREQEVDLGYKISN